MQTAAHESISDDIHLLGNLLGEAIKGLAGEEAFCPGRGSPGLGQGSPGRRVARGGPDSSATGSESWAWLTCGP